MKNRGKNYTVTFAQNPDEPAYATYLVVREKGGELFVATLSAPYSLRIQGAHSDRADGMVDIDLKEIVLDAIEELMSNQKKGKSSSAA